MTYSTTDLANDLRAYVEEQIVAGRIIDPVRVVHEVVASWSPPQCDDADKFLLGAHYVVRFELNRIVRAKRGTEDTENALPGYERAQLAYSIQRDDAWLIVPIEQITEEELRAKRDELLANSKALVDHAQELERFARDKGWIL